MIMNKEKIRKIFALIMAAYVALVTCFYFLAEDQLRYETSNKNIPLMEADTVTDELKKDTVIQQDFVNEMDNLEQVSIVFTKFYRETKGDLVIELLEGDKLLAQRKIDISQVRDQHRAEVLNETIYDVAGKKLTLKIYAESSGDSGIAIMMNKNDVPHDVHFMIDNKYIRGSLCFTTNGTDKILAGDYYWLTMSAVGALIASMLFFSYKRFLAKKSSFIITALFAIDRYRFLIKQLVSRDFKSKYKRSVLGMFWSFLNPLLTMLVQFFVFSNFFSNDTKNYPVYLLVGVICFNFFKEASDMCLVSISGNASLINKVYVPKYIFPLSRAMSSMINLGFSLLPLLIVSILMGIRLHKSFFLMFFFLICLVIFSLGVGMFLSAIMVFFRDTQFLWSVISQIWLYATPIFYPAEIIPEKYRFIVRFNPLYHFIGNARKCLIDGVSPEPRAYIYCLIFAAISLFFGSFVFKKTQDEFTLYL